MSCSGLHSGGQRNTAPKPSPKTTPSACSPLKSCLKRSAPHEVPSDPSCCREDFSVTLSDDDAMIQALLKEEQDPSTSDSSSGGRS
eukprot:3210500-Karenia_brevis.AAC.1